MENIKAIIESLIFVAGEPVSLNRLKRVLAPAASDDIRQALQELITEYNDRVGGFILKEVAGGYQFRTRSEFNQWIKLLIRPKTPRLSKPALETLAMIAYKQPIIRSDIEHIRGVDCGGVLRVLLERALIRVLGRKEIPGRPLIYGTTKHFLAVFDLKDLKDLPTPKEIEDLEEVADTGLIESETGHMDLGTDNGTADPALESTADTTPETRPSAAQNPETSAFISKIGTDRKAATVEDDYAAGQLKVSDPPHDSVTAPPGAPQAEMFEPDTRSTLSQANAVTVGNSADRFQEAAAPEQFEGQEEKQDHSDQAIHKDPEEIGEENGKNT